MWMECHVELEMPALKKWRDIKGRMALAVFFLQLGVEVMICRRELRLQ